MSRASLDADEVVRRLNGCLAYLEAQCASRSTSPEHRKCLGDMIGAINVTKVRCLALAGCRHRDGHTEGYRCCRCGCDVPEFSTVLCDPCAAVAREE